MPKLRTGDIAPDFELSDQSGENVKLSDYRGRKVLVYFYPKADTPGCTKQACSVRDNLERLVGEGVEVLGVSGDSISKQKKFYDKHGLGFKLLSDGDTKIAHDYGVLGEKSMFGKSYIGINRSAFLIDEEGKVAGAWYKIKPLETVDTVISAVEAMKS